MHSRPALLFDLDGTLVDSAQTIALALSELARSRGGGSADVAQVRRLVSKGAAAMVREVLGTAAGDSDQDVAAFREILVGIPPHAAMVYPGVVNALQNLISSGHSCAVVTNKPEQLACLLLEQLDLSAFFATVVGGDTLSVCKPSPEPLWHALGSLGAAAGVMIGDSGVDAQAAYDAGIPFVVYEEGYEAEGCAPSKIAAGFRDFAHLSSVLTAIAR